jgi:hypothetical protein
LASYRSGRRMQQENKKNIKVWEKYFEIAA